MFFITVAVLALVFVAVASAVVLVCGARADRVAAAEFNAFCIAECVAAVARNNAELASISPRI